MCGAYRVGGHKMYVYMLLFLTTLTFFLKTTSSLTLPLKLPECGPYETATDCYNDCQLTCKNRLKGYLNVCSNDCSQTGCVCLPGFFRHDNGYCVRVDDCSTPECNPDEVYNPCGNSCPDTCDERGNTCDGCSFHCVEGCFCPEGTFRNKNGTCVEESKCPARTCGGPNEYFDECPKTCLEGLDQTCSAVWIRGTKCTESHYCCRPQCRCKEGYYRDSEGFCISAKDCWYDMENFVSGGFFHTKEEVNSRAEESQ